MTVRLESPLRPKGKGSARPRPCLRCRGIGTLTWYDFKISESEYGTFDTFETEDARQDHLHG